MASLSIGFSFISSPLIAKTVDMSKHHRDRSWAPAPEPLLSPTIDNHTHVASVVPFAQEMNRQAIAREQPEVPVYSVEEILAQAAAVGVTSIIDVGCEYPNLERAIEMARRHPGTVHAGIAIHPNEAVLHGHHGAKGPDGLELKYQPWHDVSFDEALAKVATLAKSNPREVVAIGETGMDLFRTGEQAQELQRQAFRGHIALAKELNLPMQIHDRDSHQPVIDSLLADGSPDGTVFHSFSGGPEMAELANQHGWYLSFSGTVSYKGNEDIRQALALVDKDHILVETDAPYLTPMPYRGRTNAPYMIPYTLQAMAAVLGCSVREVAHRTHANAIRLYGLS